jgi:uncharacterized protein with von Willebrand factor type A (vWA) domain
MMPTPDPEAGGKLPANVMHFTRLLRRAGLPVGPGQAVAAAQALAAIDATSRADARAALAAVLAQRREQREVFDAAFDVFWRDPTGSELARAMAAIDGMRRPEEAKARAASRRILEAMAGERNSRPREEPAPDQQLDMTLTFSADEQLRQMDFEAMSAAEIASARAAIRKMRLVLEEVPTRRFRPAPAGNRWDAAATLRRALKRGELLEIARKRKRTRTPPLVVLCDISGSMTRYAQILLHFLHAVANARSRVHVFLFGTRLTNITRQLRNRDPEVAFELVGHAVPDWSGGTRIGETLANFNSHWARRVLGQGAVVLLITDGLDRDGGKDLSHQMERLKKSCRRLVWLNPLLRYEGFAPKSLGIRAMLPHVDEFRPVHNLDSLEALAGLLSKPAPPRDGRFSWTPPQPA